MASFDSELLEAAGKLLARESGLRGPLPAARSRRSISTAYYAIFHFIVEESCKRVVGSTGGQLRRRRILARSFTHTGIFTTFGKIRGRKIDPSIADFLQHPKGKFPDSAPQFAIDLANAFCDAQTKRHDADYDLNKQLNEADARLVLLNVERAIAGWKRASATADRDFKQSLSVLLLLKGQLRKD